MRIISQSGSLDMPYELVELEILEVKNELKTMYSKGYMVVACAPCIPVSAHFHSLFRILPGGIYSEYMVF